MSYFLMVDTETTNDLDFPIVYDVGLAVVDEKGKVYETHSFVVNEIFLDKKLMEIAYFSEKIPQYWEDIKKGTRVLTSFYNIKREVRKIFQKYEIKAVVAHNMSFDYRALNLTQRYITSSKYRYFFPYGTKFWDTYRMSYEVFFWDNDYREYCFTNRFRRPGRCEFWQPKLTAEVLYRYISGDIEFQESHTGLEDVMIEKEILAKCFAEKPEINGALWE